MMMEMYSVWDKKTCVYHVPVCYHNAEQVKREMQMFLEGNPGNTLGRFPGDFCIMWVGRWDDNKGCLTPAAQPEWICDLSSLISKSPAAAPTEPGVIPFPGLAEAAPPSKEAGGAVRPE